MVNELVQKYLNHSHCKWITTAVTAMIGLLFVVPAWDQTASAKSQRVKLESELQEMAGAAASMQRMQAKMQSADITAGSTPEMVDAAQADLIRENATRLVHKLSCQVRRLNLSDATTRAWADEGDDPFESAPPVGAEDSDCILETRHLNLVVEGTLSDLSRLTVALNRLNQFAVPTQMTLQRERVNGQLRLDIDLSLFNLVEKSD